MENAHLDQKEVQIISNALMTYTNMMIKNFGNADEMKKHIEDFILISAGLQEKLGFKNRSQRLLEMFSNKSSAEQK